jgi:hypothetical protein
MSNLIGISGKMGSGKDTVAELIQYLDFCNRWKSRVDLSTYRTLPRMASCWQNKKFAAKVKTIVHLLTGISAENLECPDVKASRLGPEWGSITIREMLQKVGTDAIRENLHPDAWVNALFTDFHPDSKWVISDVRFPNEAEAVERRGGLLLRVERPLKSNDRHKSEKALDDWKFDHVIYNDGTIQEMLPQIYIFLLENVWSS